MAASSRPSENLRPLTDASELAKYRVSELKTVAKKLGLSLPSKAVKAAYIDAIMKHVAAVAGAQSTREESVKEPATKTKRAATKPATPKVATSKVAAPAATKPAKAADADGDKATPEDSAEDLDETLESPDEPDSLDDEEDVDLDGDDLDDSDEDPDDESDDDESEGSADEADEEHEAVKETTAKRSGAFIVRDSDDTDEPVQRVHVAGATADPVKDYLKQIGKVALLNAEEEVELAKRIEAGLFCTTHSGNNHD